MKKIGKTKKFKSNGDTKLKNLERIDVLMALNRIDEFAENGVGENIKESKQLEKDYNKVYNYIFNIKLK